jgi:lysozyme
MKTSANGAAFIAAQEGVVTRAYRDVAGTWTIGVGHTVAAGPPRPVKGMTISRAEAMAMLARDLVRYEDRVSRSLPEVSQSALDGAVSFDFNTGAIERASWVAAFKAGDNRVARLRLMQWVKAGGRTIAGLVRRREAEARLIFDGVYGQGDASPAARAEIAAAQADLAALGLYAGKSDGIAGPETTAAVLAYQRRHPDLVADGQVGPATRASITRDIAARRGASSAAGVSVVVAATTGLGSAGAGVAHPVLLAITVGIAVLAVAAAVLAFRYRDELTRALKPTAGS